MSLITDEPSFDRAAGEQALERGVHALLRAEVGEMALRRGHPLRPGSKGPRAPGA